MNEITQHGVEGQQTALQNPRIDNGVRLASKITRSMVGKANDGLALPTGKTFPVSLSPDRLFSVQRNTPIATESSTVGELVVVVGQPPHDGNCFCFLHRLS